MAFAGTPTTLEKTVDIPATNNYASSRVLSYTDDADNGDSYGNNTYSQRRLP